MSKREVPKLNRDHFTTWKSLMKIHLGSIGNHAQNSIMVEHFDLASVPIIEDMKKKKEHNQAMLEIASSLSYPEFGDIKGCNTAFKMWDALSNMYGGDKKKSKEPSHKASEESLMT